MYRKHGSAWIVEAELRFVTPVLSRSTFLVHLEKDIFMLCDEWDREEWKIKSKRGRENKWNSDNRTRPRNRLFLFNGEAWSKCSSCLVVEIHYSFGNCILHTTMCASGKFSFSLFLSLDTSSHSLRWALNTRTIPAIIHKLLCAWLRVFMYFFWLFGNDENKEQLYWKNSNEISGWEFFFGIL